MGTSKSIRMPSAILDSVTVYCSPLSGRSLVLLAVPVLCQLVVRQLTVCQLTLGQLVGAEDDDASGADAFAPVTAAAACAKELS